MAASIDWSVRGNHLGRKSRHGGSRIVVLVGERECACIADGHPGWRGQRVEGALRQAVHGGRVCKPESESCWLPKPTMSLRLVERADHTSCLAVGRLIVGVDKTIALGTGWALASWSGRHIRQRWLVGRFALGRDIIALDGVIVSSKLGGGQASGLARVAGVVQLALILVANRLGLGSRPFPRLLRLELGRLLDLLLLRSAVLEPILARSVSA